MTLGYSSGDVINVRHHLWHADLIVEPTPHRLRHSTHQSTASYDAAGDLLWINWDQYEAELYWRKGDAYVLVDFAQHNVGVNLLQRPYTVRGGTVVELDMVSLKLPGTAGSVHVRPATSDVLVFDAIFFAGDYDIPFLNEACDIVVDLGANTGLSSVYLAGRCPNARVIAVEPARGNFAVLAANAQSRPRITPVEAAIWSHDGVIDIQDKSAAGVAWDAWAYRTVESQTGVGSYSVEALSMPTLMRRYGLGFIDVLKIDIEGAEQNLFAQPDLSWLDKVNAIVIETHERFCPGVDDLVTQALADDFSELNPRGENRVFLRRQSAP